MTETLIPRARLTLDGAKVRNRYTVALILGAVSALALPPVSFIPALIPAFSGLIWLLQGATTKRNAFAVGWWFGLGFFGAGLYWIGYAFMVNAAQHAALAVPGVAGLAGMLAIFTGLIGLLYFKLNREDVPRAFSIITFAALWTSMEWVRGWIFTGFPWNLIGGVWVTSDSMIQFAALAGVYGLSFMTICACAMPALAGYEQAKRPVGFMAVGFLSLALIGTGGAVRLHLAKAHAADVVDGVTLRLVQPNIAQADKWRKDLKQSHVLKQVGMSAEPPTGPNAPSHVIWAETAVPYVLRPSSHELLRALSDAVPPRGALITGIVKASQGGVTNSLIALSRLANITASYDKAHLVPFGEYVPLASVLPLGKLTAGALGFSPGDGLKTLNVDGLPPFSPLICYEVIFSGNVTNDADRPQWLLNITNDAWYGLSAGPYQHFAIAQMRAVEEGLPVVRVANTGISGLIDGYGRVQATLPLGEAGILDVALPTALEATPFSVHKNYPLLLLLFAVFSCILLKMSLTSRNRHVERE